MSSSLTSQFSDCYSVTNPRGAFQLWEKYFILKNVINTGSDKLLNMKGDLQVKSKYLLSCLKRGTSIKQLLELRNLQTIRTMQPGDIHVESGMSVLVWV